MDQGRGRADVVLSPAEGADAPVFLRIARAVVDDVRRGRLRPGDALPGSRSLARSLGVHRNTVLAAYAELVAEGWVVAEARGATRISRALPDVVPRRLRGAAERARVPARPAFDLGPEPDGTLEPTGLVPPGAIVLAGGVPDLSLFPAAALARALRRALRRPDVLAYGDPRGTPRLRAALATMLSALRGLAAGPEHVLVTRGSQMGLSLVARALVRPGDAVAVESLGYRPAWAAFEAAGARLEPIRVDDGGLDVGALERRLAAGPVRAVYVTPHHQYPTTVTMAPGRRLALLALAARHRLCVIEDDYDFEFHYDGRPILPLASADHAGAVVYVGTLSKLLAPGLRTGFVVAPVPLVERLAALRLAVDRQGDAALEDALAELVEDGEVGRHARRVRRAYLARRDALAEALEGALGQALSFQVPPGGMALWARAAPGIDVEAWAERALACGVVVQSGRRFARTGRPPAALRIGFAAQPEARLREGVRRLAAAL